MKNTLAVAFFCFSVGSTAQAQLLDNMTPLVNGSVADANQLNNNLEVISNQLRQLESDVNFLVDTSSRVVRLADDGRTRSAAFTRDLQAGRSGSTSADGRLQVLPSGRLELSVDCNEDSWALVDAYSANSQYPRLVFSISGACYGAIEVSREGLYTQEFSQDITIRGEGSDVTKLIARPMEEQVDCQVASAFAGGKAGLVSSFNGSLYLSDVTLELGVCDGIGLLYSRGAGGELRNVIVQAHSSYPTLRAIEVRHNAIIYMSGVEVISGQGEVFKVWSGGTVYGYGPISVRSTGTGVFANETWSAVCHFEAGANFFSYRDLTCSHDLAGQGEGDTYMAIKTRSSNFRARDVTFSGSVDIAESSNVGFRDLVQLEANSSFSVQDSYVGTTVGGSLSIVGALNLWSGSRLNADSASFAGDTKLEVNNGAFFSTVDMTFSGTGFVNGGSMVMNALAFTNATDSMRIYNSSITVHDTIDTVGGTLDCQGLSVAALPADFNLDESCMTAVDWSDMIGNFKAQPTP